MASKRRGTQAKQQQSSTSVKSPYYDSKDTFAKESPAKRPRTQPLGDEERSRLLDKDWKLWGPYLSERQWATVREDYSRDSNCWEYFPHEHAVFRAYQWGEDGLFGLSDSSANLCLGLALWNGKDKIMKERLFGLTGPQGNHGEDVKELYYYLDNTPTHSYMKALYKYPQCAFPYDDLIQKNKDRSRKEEEYEILDTGVFDKGYWDVDITVAKNTPRDLHIQYTVTNQGKSQSSIHVIPQVWFRNTWSWDSLTNVKPVINKLSETSAKCSHCKLGDYEFSVVGNKAKLLFTENETNLLRLMGNKSGDSHAKDAFHLYVVEDKKTAVKQDSGTKCGALVVLDIPPGQSRQVKVRLVHVDEKMDNSDCIDLRKQEADAFYDSFPLTSSVSLNSEQINIARQACAGLLWSKQIFVFHLNKWIKESAYPNNKINQRWKHMKNEDIISMPDKWEFPWYAPWDLAFHMIPFMYLDPDFAKNNMLILLSERYIHPNGQLPGCEFDFDDPNPPLHAWACWEIYDHLKSQGQKDTTFLKHCFQRLTINFSWWMNQKALPQNPYLFAGGFLGLDNISCVNRSFLPSETTVAQVDGTAWMAFFSAYMLKMSLELAANDADYQDIALRYLTHFFNITDAVQELWDEDAGFFYDHLFHKGNLHILKINSLVGLVPLVAVQRIPAALLTNLPEFSQTLNTYLSERSAKQYGIQLSKAGDLLLSAVSNSQLCRILGYMFDESQFLSDYGIRAVSKIHEQNPFVLELDGQKHEIHYAPGESDSAMFGGNSNWRGPIWICMNYIIYASLHQYGPILDSASIAKLPLLNKKASSIDTLTDEICKRVSNIFLPDKHGKRSVHGEQHQYNTIESWRHLLLFYEYYHGDTGRGCGASHQTGWSALIACMLQHQK